VLTDSQVQEVYAIAREALAGGQPSFQVQAFPFRMTAANLAKHRHNPNMAFWRNIKEGYDHFEVTKLEPKVDVCDKKYVFDAKPATFDSTTFNPQGACPAYNVPEEIAVAVAAKQKADESEYKVQIASIDAAERPPVDLLASILPKSTAPSVGPLATTTGAVSVADAKPINVPVPKASPLAVASASSASSYQSTEKSGGTDVIGGFLSYVKLPDFGKKDEPVAQVQPAVASVEPNATTVATTQIKTSTPVAVPVPAAKPIAATASAAPASVQPAAAPAETPWYKKLNPFGG
jgi:hypothetical protein